MRRGFVVLLLALGTVAGFGSGFASLSCHRRERERAFERHVADVCLEAANARR